MGQLFLRISMHVKIILNFHYWKIVIFLYFCQDRGSCHPGYNIAQKIANLIQTSYLQRYCCFSNAKSNHIAKDCFELWELLHSRSSQYLRHNHNNQNKKWRDDGWICITYHGIKVTVFQSRLLPPAFLVVVGNPSWSMREFLKGNSWGRKKFFPSNMCL